MKSMGNFVDLFLMKIFYHTFSYAVVGFYLMLLASI